jgi:hypothetical protein
MFGSTGVSVRLCSYVVVIDSGFAPNPFGDYCTLAVCTPNHQGLRLKSGDWVLGNSSAKTGQRMIYAMRIWVVLDFDQYYRDERFTTKRARAGGWRDRCGDNIYFRNADDQWVQALAFRHTSPEEIRRDTRHPRVFISDHFFYFGENAVVLPDEYVSLTKVGRGCRYHQGRTAEAFVEWLERTYQPGFHGQPRDREKDTVLTLSLLR